MSAQNSAAAHAVALRAGARKGLWRRLLAALGLGGARVRQADAEAARWAHGAAGEDATARLLAPLTRQGWHVRHDLRLPGRRFNLDHVLVSPCGTAVVVGDTKAWRRSWPTRVVQGRVRCGPDDRHEQVAKVAGYARLVGEALALPGVSVVPLLIVHGSPVAGGGFEAVVPNGRVWVLGTELVVPRLVGAVRTLPDSHRAAALARRVDAVLSPYGEGR
ncbi:nuclease-related domain-containing protein [Streptomyces sp. NPDC015680]|uniref:nuclease-related domain-containing protein n=1 Tax=Streptomyces sp. NPDC015680 TaxID=3364962 RepID=UPI00370326F8